MSREMIYTDPHHGLNLKANTTPESRRRLTEYVASHTAEVLKEHGEDAYTICAGDFFHEHDNSSEVMASALGSFNGTDLILEGNHDVSTVRYRYSSLKFLQELEDRHAGPRELSAPKVVTANFAEPSFSLMAMRDKVYWLLPHQTDQDIFDAALEQVAEHAASSTEVRKKFLIAHCNYDNPFARDQTSLNMSKAQAVRLLEVFDAVILGHEHTFKTDLNDRLIVLGSPHPTNFGDISEKFVLEIDAEGEMLIVPVWSPDEHYLEMDWQGPVLDALCDKTQFVKLTGMAAPADAPALAKVIKGIWKYGTPFAVKSEVSIIRPSGSLLTEEDRVAVSVLEKITKELATDSPAQYELWKEVSSDN